MEKGKNNTVVPVDTKKSLIKDGFFGWNNFKWIVVQIRDVYSSKKSHFSKKRFESGIGFIIAEWGMIYFLLKKMDSMDIMTFGGWAAIQFFVAGYIIKQIQNEKIENTANQVAADAVDAEAEAREKGL